MKILPQPCIPVSDCDMAIGQAEFRLHNLPKSYLALYTSYRTRYTLLGAQNPLTVSAGDLTASCRYISGERLYCGRELKDKAASLRWASESAGSFQYAAALFISRVADEASFTVTQTRDLLQASHAFYKSRLSSIQSAESVDGLAEDLYDQLAAAELDGSRMSPMSPAKSPSKASSSSGKRNVPSRERKGERSVDPEPSTPSTPSKVEPNVASFTPVSKLTISAPESPANTWRRIPAGSPLRTQALSPMNFSAPSVGMRGAYQLLRDGKSDALLVVQRSTPRLLRDCLGSKLAAFGIIAWLAESEDLATGGDGELANRRRSSVARPISLRMQDAKKKSMMRSASLIGAPVPPIPEPKNALAAMLGKRFAPQEALPEAAGVTVSTAPSSSSAGTSAAKAIPVPPPLPTCWPPVPYSSSAVGPAPVSVVGMFGSVDGDTPKAPAKPKVKQAALAALPSIEGTFWAEPQDVLLPIGELFDDLEEQFLVGVKKKKSIAMHGGAKKTAANPLKKAAAVQEGVLDPQRSQNINIMLAKFGKRSMESIAESIMNFEADALGISSLSALLQFVPTADEIKKIADFIAAKVKAKGADAPSTVDTKALAAMNIGRAEQYIFAMSKVTLMDKRLTAMASTVSTAETCPAVISQADALLNATAEVKGSGKLKFILRTFLDLNNALAQQAGLPPSGGFHLTSWRKLSQLKSNSNETMEQYVVNKLLATVPEALQLTADFPSLEEGKQVMLTRLQAEVRKQGEAISLLKELLAAEAADSIAAGHLNKHIDALSRLHAKAKHQVDLAQSDFNDVCVYYGYTSANLTAVHEAGSNVSIDPETFFLEVKDLCRNLAEATQQNTKARRKAIKG